MIKPALKASLPDTKIFLRRQREMCANIKNQEVQKSKYHQSTLAETLSIEKKFLKSNPQNFQNLEAERIGKCAQSLQKESKIMKQRKCA